MVRQFSGSAHDITELQIFLSKCSEAQVNVTDHEGSNACLVATRYGPQHAKLPEDEDFASAEFVGNAATKARMEDKDDDLAISARLRATRLGGLAASMAAGSGPGSPHGKALSVSGLSGTTMAMAVATTGAAAAAASMPVKVSTTADPRVAWMTAQVVLVDMLHRYGCDVTAKDSKGRCPMWWAFHPQQYHTSGSRLEPSAVLSATISIPLVESLLVKGADANLVLIHEQPAGSTLLHAACRSGQADLVRLLLDYGADLQATDENGHTPLHAAAVTGHDNVIDVLAERSVDVDVQDPLGLTVSLLCRSVCR